MASFLHYIYDFIAALVYVVQEIFHLVSDFFSPIRFIFYFVQNALPTPQQYQTATTTSITFLSNVSDFFTANASAVNLSMVWGIVYALFIAVMMFAFFKEFKKL